MVDGRWSMAPGPATIDNDRLSLALFMFRVFADHPHHALAADDLALVANLFDRSPYFHDENLCDL
jgi:hypothetical protein